MAASSAKNRADLGEERGLVGDGLQPSAGEGGRGRRQVAVARAGVEQVEPGAVRRRVRQVVAGAGQHAGAPRRRLGGQVAGQRRLADARFAAEEHEPAAPPEHGGELLAQEDLLQRPADEERRRSRGARAGRTGGAVHGRGDAVHRCPIEPARRPRIVPIRSDRPHGRSPAPRATRPLVGTDRLGSDRFLRGTRGVRDSGGCQGRNLRLPVCMPGLEQSGSGDRAASRYDSGATRNLVTAQSKTSKTWSRRLSGGGR